MAKTQNAFFIIVFSVLPLGTVLISTASAESKSGGLTSAVGHVNAKAEASLLPNAIVKAEALHRSANLSYKVSGKRYFPRQKVASFTQVGLASWYGKQFHGRKTSSGERYDMNMMTAAHKTLPIPSYARVTNLANGKSVVVRINDRGPFHSSRVMDLSKAAAQKLGFIRRGTAKVRVEQILPGQKQLADQSQGKVYVDLKSFDRENQAKSYLIKTNQHLRSANSDQKVIMVKQNNQYVVRMGPFQSNKMPTK